MVAHGFKLLPDASAHATCARDACINADAEHAAAAAAADGTSLCP